MPCLRGEGELGAWSWGVDVRYAWSEERVWLSTPSDQTHHPRLSDQTHHRPSLDTPRYGQPAVGTHPIGMHSCFTFCLWGIVFKCCFPELLPGFVKDLVCTGSGFCFFTVLNAWNVSFGKSSYLSW